MVQKARRGDVMAFERLVLAHQQFTYNLALRGVGDRHEAEDITQEAFLRAWKGLPHFRAQSRFATWLYRIVVNLCYNRLPQLKRELQALDIDEDPDALPELIQTRPDKSRWMGHDLLEAVIDHERETYLQQEIENLPESYRLMALLRYKQEMAYEEIAEILDVPVGRVKTGLFRARRQLRAALEQFELSRPKKVVA